MDDNLTKLSQAFDYEFTGTTTFKVPEFESFNVPDRNDFSIGLICGPSGSGKTQMAKKYFGEQVDIKWDREKSIISHFEDYDEGVDRVMSVGLSSIPSICRPYHVLSMGEQFRSNMSRSLNDNALIDEYTSVVNRDVAMSTSVGIKKFITRRNFKGIVFISCHYDIIEWLQPDWVFDTGESLMTVNTLSEYHTKIGNIKF